MKKYLACSAAVLLAAFVSVHSGHCEIREVVDDVGRTVRVPADPRRVIAMAPSLTEVVFALGQEHRLAGITRFSDYPEQTKDLPKVGSYVHLDLEKIMALQPDLCLAVKDGNPIAVVQRLEGLGIPVYAISPQNVDQVADMIIGLGDVLGAPARGKALADDMRRRIQAVKTAVSTARKKPKVFFQIGIAPIVSAGDHTFINELIHLAGGVNLTSGRIPYPRLTSEEVISLAPDVFIITSMARNQAFEKVKAYWKKWQSIPAVRNERIFLVDSNIVDRPTPRLIDGLEALARLFHPDLFKVAP